MGLRLEPEKRDQEASTSGRTKNKRLLQLGIIVPAILIIISIALAMSLPLIFSKLDEKRVSYDLCKEIEEIVKSKVSGELSKNIDTIHIFDNSEDIGTLEVLVSLNLAKTPEIATNDFSIGTNEIVPIIINVAAEKNLVVTRLWIRGSVDKAEESFDYGCVYWESTDGKTGRYFNSLYKYGTIPDNIKKLNTDIALEELPGLDDFQ